MFPYKVSDFLCLLGTGTLPWLALNLKVASVWDGCLHDFDFSADDNEGFVLSSCVFLKSFLQHFKGVLKDVFYFFD